MKYKQIICIYMISLAAILYACQKDQVDYYSLVERGLSSGEIHDSLFLGYHFGMERQDFFDHSWSMNQAGKLTGMVKVEYQPDWLPYDSKMLFYPDFVDDRISNIPVDFSYDAWAPWNPGQSSDSLMVHLKEFFEREYGQDFHRVYIPPHRSTGFFSVKGNRAISIFRKDEMTATVHITDLRHVSLDQENDE